MKTSRHANDLRKNQTDTERKLWRALRNNQLEGYKFRRQHPIGDYIVDFVCLEKRVVVEVDGSQHLQNKKYDTNRDKWLIEQGYSILRFWDNEVLMNLEGALEMIRTKLRYPHPNPLPPPEGEGKKNNKIKRAGTNPHDP